MQSRDKLAGERTERRAERVGDRHLEGGDRHLEGVGDTQEVPLYFGLIIGRATCWLLLRKLGAEMATGEREDRRLYRCLNTESSLEQLKCQVRGIRPWLMVSPAERRCRAGGGSSLKASEGEGVRTPIA